MLYQITYRCSMGCPHCMMDAKPTGVDAGMATTAAFVDFANSLGTIKWGISGGEPTEHPEFIRHISYIVEKAQEKATIVLITNGQFFVSNEPLVRALSTYQNNVSDTINGFGFFIQVSAIPELYSKTRETVRAVKQYSDLFVKGTVEIIDKLTVMDSVGRAKGKDWSHLGSLFERTAPNCINIFLMVKSGKFKTLKEAMVYYEAHSSNFCKPSVSPFGEVRAGESPECFKIGNIHEDTHKDMFNRIWEGNPCGNCGLESVDVPQNYARKGA